jgi:glycosyltransferase involved in cell wall biosynthesis
MKDSAFDLTVAGFSDTGHMPEFLEVMAADGVRTEFIATRSGYDRAAIGKLRTLIRERRIDILCTHEYRSHLIGMIARRGTTARWVALSRGWTKENLKIRAYHTLDRLVIRFADRIVAVSRSQAERLRNLCIPASRIVVVANAIDAAAFESIPAVNLHAKFGLETEAVVAVAAGRFSTEKGQRFLLKASAQAFQRCPRLAVVMFGDGPDRARLIREIASMDLDSRILCPGFEKNLIGCLKGAGLLVNPSQSEGLPNIVMEAMAVSTPVVATAVGGVPELIEDGVSGLLLKYGDVGNMALAMQRMATDPDLRSRLAAAAHDVLDTQYSFDHQAEQLTALYREVLG